VKQFLKLFIPLLLIGVVVFLVNSISGKVKHIAKAGKVSPIMPGFRFYDLSGNDFSKATLRENDTAIIYFNSECEHCQYEIKAIKENIEQFANSNIVMVSGESREAILAFAKEYELSEYSNIHVLEDKDDTFFSTFGSNMVPSIFIYGKNKMLIKHFKGETKISAILKYLHQDEAVKAQ